MSECPDELLSGYLDGELSDADARAVEAHLAECPSCAAELEGLRELTALSQHMSAPAVSDAEWAAGWDAISARIAPARKEARPSLWKRLGRLRYALVPAAAAALIALAVGVWGLGPYNEAEAEECVVEFVESAEGYSSSYYHSDEADVTIITLVPVDAEETTPSDESQDTR